MLDLSYTYYNQNLRIIILCIYILINIICNHQNVSCPGRKGHTRDVGRAEKVQIIANARLLEHKNTRGVNKSKHNNFVFRFFGDNLGRLCAISESFGHLQLNKKPASSGSLLSHSHKRFVLVDDGVKVTHGQGCYLHRDTNTAEFVRSGKIAGDSDRGFKKRNDEHESSAAQLTENAIDSIFYSTYPTTPTEGRSWEDLDQYVGLGFDPKKDDAINSITAEDGLFYWSPEVQQLTNDVQFAGCTEIQKRTHMVAYMFELFYDLLLSPEENLSSSPGFETPLGIF
jgi:hypothetical protein